jgi:dihydroxyacetone kinase-like protein
MAESLTTDVLRDAIRRLSAQAESCADELNALDGALGDGDLGVTLVRGMRAVADQAEDLSPDLGAALLQSAKALVSLSGSTYGTLLATGVMSVAKAAKDRTEVGWRETAELLAEAMAAMQRRGKVELGDKTVLDAIAATVEALRRVDTPEAMLPAAQQAVREAIDEFRARPARQGRARMFGENSVGKDDPGMVAWLRLLEGLS